MAVTSRNSFGRLVAPPDARDLRYRMMAVIPQIIAATGRPAPRKRAYKDGPLLDQGPTPTCVGFSARGFLDAAPIMSKPAIGPGALNIYAGAQVLDEWPGEDYAGSSVRGAMKYLSQVGQISSYVWGQSVADAIAWMNGGYGTIVVGTDWYAEMSDVDGNGFMREPAGSLSTPIGGHAWRWIWYDTKKKGILMRNSWGAHFGWPLRSGTLSGYAFLSTTLAERLLAANGEIAAATQIKIKAVTVSA